MFLGDLQESIEIMCKETECILEGCTPSFMLCGSIVLDDFRFGWSDIDFLCVTKSHMASEQSELLLGLRQQLSRRYPNNPYFALFEGAFMSESHLFKDNKAPIVYWGTSGQRIVDDFEPDLFSCMELIEKGKLLFGQDFRQLIHYPTEAAIFKKIQRHYETIRKYGGTTGESLYSAGWVLDIARCLYTLKYNNIISKTGAGEWARDAGLCPDAFVIDKVLEIRKNPALYKNDEETRYWLAGLDPIVQKFADVLGEALLAKQ